VPRFESVARLASHEFPPSLAERLRRRAPPNVERVLDVSLHQIRELAIAATDHIDDLIERLRRRGVAVEARSVCCRRSNCYTCLGRYDLHYPAVYRKVGDEWRHVRTRDLRPFLRGAGLSEGEVAELMDAIDVRTALVKIHNYLCTLFNHLGLARVTLER